MCVYVLHSVGGKRKRWNDVVLKDLKNCDLLPDWPEEAPEWGAWWELIHEALSDLNSSHEGEESLRKDQLKQRREVHALSVHPQSPSLSPFDTSLPLSCTVSGCSCVGHVQTKAVLANYTRQRHAVVAQTHHLCPHCGGSFDKQGLHNHSCLWLLAIHMLIRCKRDREVKIANIYKKPKKYSLNIFMHKKMVNYGI